MQGLKKRKLDALNIFEAVRIGDKQRVLECIQEDARAVSAAEVRMQVCFILQFIRTSYY